MCCRTRSRHEPLSPQSAPALAGPRSTTVALGAGDAARRGTGRLAGLRGADDRRRVDTAAGGERGAHGRLLGGGVGPGDRAARAHDPAPAERRAGRWLADAHPLHRDTRLRRHTFATFAGTSSLTARVFRGTHVLLL